MKLVDLFEADVVDITKQTGTRKYGANGYKPFIDPTDDFKMRTVPGIDEQPAIRISKRYSQQMINKALVDCGLSQSDCTDVAITYNMAGQHPYIRLSFDGRSLLKSHTSNGMHPDMAKRWIVSWKQRTVKAVGTAFGNLVTNMVVHDNPTSGLTIDCVMSTQFLSTIGVNIGHNKPKIRELIIRMLKKHNIGGINHVVAKQGKTGCFITVSGAERIDSNSVKKLEIDLNKTFGGLFRKLEVSSIDDVTLSTHAIPEGLVTYRLVFSPELASTYSMDNRSDLTI